MVTEFIHCMDKRPAERSTHDLNIIYDRLRSIKNFQKIHPQLLQQICYYCYYEDLDKDVTLFRQGDSGTNWYAVLTGSLVVLVSSRRQETDRFCTLGIGSVFGESILNDGPRHSTVVTKEHCELLRVEQKDFKLMWENNRTYMEESLLPLCSATVDRLKRDVLEKIAHHSTIAGHWRRRPPATSSTWVHLQDVTVPYSALPITEEPSEDLLHCAFILRTLIVARCPHMIRDRKYHMRTYRRCLVGVEMVDWLLQLDGVIRTRSQAVMAWQALLEEGVIFHVSYEHHFKDKYLFYRFHDDILPPDAGTPESPDKQDVADAEAEIFDALGLLLHVGPDAVLRMILRKPPHERTVEDLEIIYDELRHIKALSHLSNSVKRELAAVLAFEAHPKAGAALFHQGDEGRLWYIILKGSVDVVIRGKGTVCSLYEGDDFGKLALVNDSPRAATIVLREDNCHFLSVDKDDFNRILRDVEANTVRLKEHGQDVLILQKISVMIQTPDSPQQKYRYFIVAGTPQKILEHLLETCVDIKSDDFVDVSLEDFLYTHVLFMPYHQLCPELMKFYLIESSCPTQDHEYVLTFKKKVMQFLHTWTFLIGDPVFQDSTFVSLIEDLAKIVHADHISYGTLHVAVDMMSDIMAKYERFQSIREKDPGTKWELLPSGHIISHVNAEVDERIHLARSPMKMTDDCLFRVYCADHTYCTLKLPLGATAEMVKRYASERMGLQDVSNIYLVEVKSNREKVIFKDHEISIPTSLSVNGRLFIIPKEHLDALMPLPDQDGPRDSSAAILDEYGSKELAAHITAIDWELFSCIHEYELVYHAFGRHQYKQVTSNLDVFVQRFTVLQQWPTTEICLARSVGKRVQLLKLFIKIAAHCYELHNLSAFLAITLGLGNVAVGRLVQTWEKLPGKYKKMYNDFESLLDPSRNHRMYRLTVSKMSPPFIPLVPLLIKDLLFAHEGNKTYLEGLVNFEKMHLLAESLRAIKNARSKPLILEMPANSKDEEDINSFFRNIGVIDNQKILDHLSRKWEPRRT